MQQTTKQTPFYKKPAFLFLLLGLFVIGLRFLHPRNVHEVLGLEKVHVVRVKDGDTIVVDKNGEETLRFIGIDAPESVNVYEPEKNCEEGKEVSAYVKDLIEGKDIYLEYDSKYKDRFSRILAYVYLDQDGKHMLQEELLEKGMVRTMSIKPNLRYKDHFEDLENQAKKEGVGYWGTGFFQ